MKKTTYLLVLIIFSTIAATRVFAFVGTKFFDTELSVAAELFMTLFRLPLVDHIGSYKMSAALSCLVLFLSFRRVRLFTGQHSINPPSTYKGLPYALGVISSLFIFLFFLVAAVTFSPFNKGGNSFIPAALALQPALYTMPLSFFLTELLSLRPES